MLRRGFGPFQHWCAEQGVAPLPAALDLVAAYVDHMRSIDGRNATVIRQAVWAIVSLPANAVPRLK
jgi:hypothetical protein